MNRSIGLLMSIGLVTAGMLWLTPQASAGTGACGALGAHYAINSVGGTTCYQIEARMAATDMLTNKTTYYFGGWVNKGGTSTSYPSPSTPSSFSSYTTLTDSYVARSDV